MHTCTNKISRLYLLLLLLLFLGSIHSVKAQVLYKKQAVLMGSVFEITLVDQDSLSAKRNIGLVIDEIVRIENLISEWNPKTQISEVNRNAGIKPVKVNREVFDLTKRAIYYSKLSQGAFDISIAAMDHIWKFDGSMTELPAEAAINKSVETVGFQHILLDSINSTIYLEKTGMKIGFGSIGKGYAADKGRELMLASGVKGGIVNASGDLTTWGQQLNLKPWIIGINHPFKPHKILKKIKLTESAVATSGNYEKYAEIGGKRYAHIINPKTGYPATGLASVSIYGPSAEFANALSTSIMVLGKKEGLKLLRKFPAYGGVFMSDKGKVTKYAS